MGLDEGPPHLVGLGRRHSRHVHDELHHLLLPDDDAAAPLQGALLQWMVVLPGYAPCLYRSTNWETALPWTPTPGRMRATW